MATVRALSRADSGAAALDALGDGAAHQYSELALAERFEAEYSGAWLYVNAWGRWLRYTGNCWAPETTRHAFDNARAICKAAAGELLAKDSSSDRLANRIASAQTVAAVERIAMGIRSFAATPDQWDADPWLLNTPSGEIDLRTGMSRPNSAASFSTKVTGAAPGGPCERWLQFLDESTGGDTDMVEYLQRLIGMMLTGDVREHLLIFLWGPGGNGKSVLLNIVEAALGAYATRAPIEAFTETKGDRHPTDLAGLRGARMVAAVETEEGRRWAESKIKALTGGDPITARFMRQDFFTFKPQFKMVIVGNHKPAIRNVDEAMRRRLHLIPFTNRPKSIDKQLEQRLRAELGGILHWAIDGCLKWQRDGLRTPERVRKATDDYFEAEDAFGEWLSERTMDDPNGDERTDDLFKDWRRWAEQQNAFGGDVKRLVANLESRGYERRDRWSTLAGKRSKTRVIRGLKLLYPASVPTHWSDAS